MEAGGSLVLIFVNVYKSGLFNVETAMLIGCYQLWSEDFQTVLGLYIHL